MNFFVVLCREKYSSQQVTNHYKNASFRVLKEITNLNENNSIFLQTKEIMKNSSKA